MITQTQKDLVKTSFEKVYPIADTAAELFYNRLFELDPTLKPMFKGNMKEQGRKLFNMLRSAVTMLDRLEQLTPVLEEMGRKHSGYGVKDKHYDTVAAALLWTLEQGLAEEFNDECKNAWVTVYTVIAQTMQQSSKNLINQ